MDRVIHPALKGKPAAWFAPNYRLLADVWRQLQASLAGVITRVNQQEHRIELYGGGSIEMWSLESPDAGRGRAYAVVVIDEAAMVPNLDQAWQQSIRNTLTDLLGQAWFLSTPKGMNYFKVSVRSRARPRGPRLGVLANAQWPKCLPRPAGD